MYATKHLDWLSITFETGTQMAQVFPTFDWHYVGRGMHGYNFMYRDKLTGAIYHEAGHSDEMGVHLQISGDALARIRSERGGTDDGLVRLLSDRHGYASRVDLTVNIHDGELTPRRMFEELKAGKLKARTRTYRFIEGSREHVKGETLYLGSPDSDRQLRAYDKAAELGIQNGSSWLRLELELRRLRANSAFQSSVLHGVAETVTGHVGDFLAWDHQEYVSALLGEAALPQYIPRRESSRRRWLLGQVAQALAKEIREDVDFRALFDAAVQEAFDNLN